MKNIYYSLFSILLIGALAMSSCESLDTENLNNPPTEQVLASGSDLTSIIGGGYISWWQGVHDVHPVNALMIASDQYGVSWGNFGGRRMGEEPRASYNNRPSEDPDYKQVNEDPWFGCLSAASTSNDILNALADGINIDNGGPLDQSITAAAYFLRGISRGYIGLIFDKGFSVDADTDLAQRLEFVDYKAMIASAVSDLDQAIAAAGGVADADFTHTYFSGISMSKDQFIKLCHSYAAKFLTQWPRTEAENGQVDWNSVKSHAQQGIDFDFAPVADGGFWFSYHRYALANTGQGGFWALVDQRLVAAMDPSQPTRYPEVQGKGEAALADSMATSDDARFTSDFVFSANHGGMPVERGEWHFSHYKHNRNVSDPTWGGDGSSFGPMPTFLAADNDMLLAEAHMRLSELGDAIAIINAGTRVTRGGLDPLDGGASADEVEYAIMYERAIELLGSAPFNMWMDRRRIGPRVAFNEVDDLGGLQLQTPAHLPIPADELGVLEETFYNFGGSQDPEGINGF